MSGSGKNPLMDRSDPFTKEVGQILQVDHHATVDSADDHLKHARKLQKRLMNLKLFEVRVDPNEATESGSSSGVYRASTARLDDPPEIQVLLLRRDLVIESRHELEMVRAEMRKLMANPPEHLTPAMLQDRMDLMQKREDMLVKRFEKRVDEIDELIRNLALGRRITAKQLTDNLNNAARVVMAARISAKTSITTQANVADLIRLAGNNTDEPDSA